MSEKNTYNEDFDLMMKSILEEAREDVPDHVWEGVAAGLDKAAQHKVLVLRRRRAAVGIAAAAALAVGVFLRQDAEDNLVSPAGERALIAVAEPAVEAEEDVIMIAEVRDYETPAEISAPKSAAEALREVEHMEAPSVNADTARKEGAEAVEAEEYSGETSAVGPVGSDELTVQKEAVREKEPDTDVYFPEDWSTDEKKKERKVSIVLSGIAGTNNTLNQNKLNPMKAPGLTSAPKRTGVEQTSVRSSYGIPLSFGVGAKFDLGKGWSIGAGLNYSFLSRQFYGKYTKVNSEGEIETSMSSDINNRQHYIGIPVNVFYDIISNERISFYTYAGGTVEKCLSNSYDVLNTPVVHKEKVSGVQLSVNAGIGVEFMLGKHLGIYLDPSLRYYFDNKQPKSIRTAQPLMFGFELGLRARL